MAVVRYKQVRGLYEQEMETHMQAFDIKDLQIANLVAQVKYVTKHIEFMPKELEPGILYVADQYVAVAHPCPCGCGSKVKTPLGEADWSLREDKGGPTLYPSIGLWQLPCRSHYWIRNGGVQWLYDWSEYQIEAGLRFEEERQKLATTKPPLEKTDVLTTCMEIYQEPLFVGSCHLATAFPS